MKTDQRKRISYLRSYLRGETNLAEKRRPTKTQILEEITEEKLTTGNELGVLASFLRHKNKPSSIVEVNLGNNLKLYRW